MARHAKIDSGLQPGGRYLEIARKRRRSRLIKRIGIGVAAVIAVAALAVGGYYLWFRASLDSALSKHTDANVFSSLDEAKSGAFYTLLLGSDIRHEDVVGRGSEMQTDVIMLMRTDPVNNTVTMLSIPRDTPVKLDNGETVKINALYNMGGVSRVVQEVKKLTGLPISHYAMVYMSDCKNVVDALGGVEVDVPIEINNNDPETEENVNIQPGLQVLDGRHAQAFAISRHEAEGPEESYRQGKIRALIEAIMKKALDRPITEIPGTIINLAQYVETDLRTDDLIALARNFSDGGVTVYSATGPSDGDFYGADETWYCYENPEGWKAVVKAVDSGQDPSDIDYESTQIVPAKSAA